MEIIKLKHKIKNAHKYFNNIINTNIHINMKLVRIKQPLVCGSLSHGSIIMPSSCGTSGKRLLLQFSHLVLRHETHDERHNRAAEVILNNLPNTWEDTQEFEIDYTNVPDNTGWLTSEESLHYAHTGQLPYRMEKDILIEKEEGILKRAQALALENPSPTDPRVQRLFEEQAFLRVKQQELSKQYAQERVRNMRSRRRRD